MPVSPKTGIIFSQTPPDISNPPSAVAPITKKIRLVQATSATLDPINLLPSAPSWIQSIVMPQSNDSVALWQKLIDWVDSGPSNFHHLEDRPTIINQKIDEMPEDLKYLSTTEHFCGIVNALMATQRIGSLGCEVLNRLRPMENPRNASMMFPKTSGRVLQRRVNRVLFPKPCNKKKESGPMIGIEGSRLLDHTNDDNTESCQASDKKNIRYKFLLEAVSQAVSQAVQEVMETTKSQELSNLAELMIIDPENSFDILNFISEKDDSSFGENSSFFISSDEEPSSPKQSKPN